MEWPEMERITETATERCLTELVIDIVESIEKMCRVRHISTRTCMKKAKINCRTIDKVLQEPEKTRLATLVRIADALDCEIEVKLCPKESNNGE